MLQELDLAQGALGQDLLAEDIGDLFDGDTLVGLVVDSGTATWRTNTSVNTGLRITVFQERRQMVFSYQTIP